MLGMMYKRDPLTGIMEHKEVHLGSGGTVDTDATPMKNQEGLRK